MNYKDMSNFDINCEVAMIINPILQNADEDLVTEVENGAANFRLCNAIGEDLDAGTYDYCNNLLNAWPIILENKIALIPTFDIWDASKGGFQHIRRNFRFQDKNPFKAAMVVFLKMQKEKL